MRWLSAFALLIAAIILVLPQGVEAATFDVSNTNDAGPGSFRQAIHDANANPGPDIIDIDTPGTVLIGSPLPPLTGATEIHGPGVNDFTIDFNGSGNGLQINPVVVLVRDLTITRSSEGGMFIAAGANVTLLRVAIIENSSPNPGGGINNQGTLLIEDSLIAYNETAAGGGGISNAGDLTVRDSDIHNNTAVGGPGGGLSNCGLPCSTAPTMEVYDSVVGENSSPRGGGIHNGQDATLLVKLTTVGQNNAASQGGGINNFGIATILFSEVRENIAGAIGGGIANNGSLTIKHSHVDDNEATSSGGGGGGIHNCNSSGFGCADIPVQLTVFDSTVNGNFGAFGGGIHSYGPAYISKSEIKYNTSALGGGISSWQAALEVYHTEIKYNAANGNQVNIGIGGGVFNFSADGLDVLLEGVKVAHNSAEDKTGGGGIFNCGGLCAQVGAGAAGIASTAVTPPSVDGQIVAQQASVGIAALGVLQVKHSLIAENEAYQGGGIVNDAGANMSIVSSTIDANTALTAGGINNRGSLEVLKSTISNNTATGADASTGPGGGLFNTGSATLTNVTVSGNSAGSGHTGGGIFNCNDQCSLQPGTAQLDLLNVTIAYNSADIGGGINNSAGATARLKHVLLAHNTGGNCWELMTSLGHNLSDDDTCAASFNQIGDQNNADANIGPLVNNGGPTQTHALLLGSDAIDAGTNAGCPSTDQRGVSRPQSAIAKQIGMCDIGAYEYERPSRDLSGPRNPRRGSDGRR